MPQVKDTKFVDAALRYAALGWRVFPCVPGEKRPLIHDWPNRATTDPAQIREWWGRWPEANVAIVTGGGLAVLDFDPRSGGDYWDSMDLPATCVVHTGGGGRHYYFAAPAGLRSGKVGAGIDLKAEGGYVIAPPSVHPSGGRYEWEAGAAPWESRLAPLPDWAQGTPQANGAPRADSLWRLYKDRPIPQGQRNNVLTSLAGHLRRHGHGEAEILAKLREWNARCIPPLPDREVESIAKSIARYPAPERPIPGRQTKLERAAEVLARADWVRFRGRPYLAHGGELFPLAQANAYLAIHGVFVGAQTGREAAELAMRAAERQGRIRPLEGLVLMDGSLRYGIGGGREGIWFRHRGKVYCYTTAGRLEAYSAPPAGVYYVVGAELPIMPEGGDEADLLEYMALALANLHVPARREVAIAAILPVILGLGRAGLLLEGEGGSGKSTCGKAIYRLAYGSEPPTPIGDSRRDLVATMAGRRLAYHDDLEVLDADQEAIIRIGITGGKAEVRELYTTMPEQVDLVEGAILCGVSVGFRDTTTIQRMIRLHFRAKRRGFERDIEQAFAELAPRAMAGALRLFARAAREAPPDPMDMPEMRLRDWFGWAIRFARVLRVEAEFREWLGRMDEGLLERIQPWGALWHLLREGAVEVGRPILLSDLARQVLMRQGLDEGEAGEAAKRLVAGVARGAARQKLATVAERAGFAFELRRERDSGSRKQRWFVVFERRTYEAPERAEARDWAMEVLGRLDGMQATEAPAPVPIPVDSVMATEGQRVGTQSLPSVLRPLEDRIADLRQKVEALCGKLLDGIDPNGLAGGVIKAYTDHLLGAVDALGEAAKARALGVLSDDLGRKADEVYQRAEGLVRQLLGAGERIGRIRPLARIEAAPGRDWSWVAVQVRDTLNGVGLDQLVRRYSDWLSWYDPYKARIGIVALAGELLGLRDECKWQFESVWPNFRAYLQGALGDGWQELLGIPDEPMPSVDELPF